ncbi:MAG: S-methyl-5'-thioinosine phosphorylase [Gammaproteobacteria bacterium]|nr:S-methyl-5'-thioinosine phosphorylase [Gammaproteobacteria bacterium]NIP90014.1 S-methyl-5'-thioinosine phosphorylase [Gammaproteobacteria bacterium]NIR22742.1 S-methyl-5'-thioinosine phosphorylase [Gammaproteobacteria bacterium]NIS04632.1 S-methyl-5'-thioinosine phosphorylase [Gammaproteobacteria bacterium]NIU40488.1 S-methyl-5'-thioinosine phosphorylase [Gammaproteobacteria bacterium]
MTDIAIIGGTGLSNLIGLTITGREVVRTPWGEPSGPVTHGTLGGRSVAFLPRHGTAHTIPPHKVNYRANIWALKEIGIREIVAVAAVGGIHADFTPGVIAVPDQIVDYTWSRGHTFFEDDLSHVVHVDFTEPYCPQLRASLIAAAAEAGVEVRDWGTYAITQGPRLESAAEVDRLERDGCHIVGMTGMPEAALAREAELRYAHCAVVSNAAAGRGQGTISMQDILDNLETGMQSARALLAQLLSGR